MFSATAMTTMSTTICAGSVLLLILLVFKLLRVKPFVARPIPSGPRGNWLLGNVGIDLEDLCKKLFAWRKTHGPVFKFHLLPFSRPLFAIINDVGLAKEMLQDRKFAGRLNPGNPSIVYLNPNEEGILFQAWSPIWKDLQRFVLSTLSAMGFGRSRMEDRVVAEADALVDAVLATNGAHLELEPLFRVAVSNVITGLVFGERTEIGQASPIHDRMKIFVEGFVYLVVHPIYNVFPWLGRLLPTNTLTETVAARNFALKYIDDSLEHHRKTLDPEEPRDFIDAILVERSKRPDADHLSDGNVRQTMLDLFLGGTDTTSYTMSWVFAWLLHLPDIRLKLLDEIRAVVGPDGAPTLQELHRFNYVQAFLDEVWRRSCVIDLAPHHRPIQPVVNLAGYDVPDDLSLVVNIWGIHHDPDLFEEPFQFRPERFLDASGRYVKNENVITFSLGTRRCIGEKLARLEAFVFTVRLLQRVEFRSVEGRLPYMEGRKPGPRTPGDYLVTAKVAE